MNYAANIRTILGLATAADVVEGREWYPVAGGAIEAIAASTGRDEATVAAVVAALSPQNRWERNLVDAEHVCAGDMEHRPCTFGPNTVKARRIAAGEPWSDVLRGPKVTAFVANMTGDGEPVTVDLWAIRAATRGERTMTYGSRDYTAIADAYRLVASEAGERPCDLQAIVWVTARRIGLGQIDRRTGIRRLVA